MCVVACNVKRMLLSRYDFQPATLQTLEIPYKQCGDSRILWIRLADTACKQQRATFRWRLVVIAFRMCSACAAKEFGKRYCWASGHLSLSWSYKWKIEKCRHLCHRVVASGGQGCPAPPFEICAAPFHGWSPRLLHSSDIVFRKCGPSVFFGSPAAKSWRQPCFVTVHCGTNGVDVRVWWNFKTLKSSLSKFKLHKRFGPPWCEKVEISLCNVVFLVSVASSRSTVVRLIQAEAGVAAQHPIMLESIATMLKTPSVYLLNASRVIAC